MKNEKIKISKSRNGKRDSLILLFARIIVNLFYYLHFLDENSLCRSFVDGFIMNLGLFFDCRSMTLKCRLNVGSMKVRLCNPDSIANEASNIPMGYYKLIPQYLPRAPD
ncbi:MAG: hypothetical protein WC644_10820 [Ignavibacteria bacterium]